MSHSTVNIFLGDGIIGELPNEHVHNIIIKFGTLKDIVKEGRKYIKTLPKDVKVNVILSAGTVFIERYTLRQMNYDSYSALSDKILANTLRPLTKLRSRISKRGGKLMVASILPQPWILDESKEDVIFLTQCYEDINSLIWDFNKESNVSTINLKQYVENKNNKKIIVKGYECKMKKFVRDRFNPDCTLKDSVRQKCFDLCKF